MELFETAPIYEHLKKLEAEQTDHVLLYHGTCLSAFKEIARAGTFIPQKQCGSDALENGYLPAHFEGLVFMTNCEQDAGHYSTLACSNMGQYDNGDIQTIIGALVPKEILLPDLGDCPDANDWTDSLKQMNAVCIRGNLTLPKEQLFLLFTDYETGNPLYFTTDLDVQTAFNKAVESLQKNSQLSSM